MSNDNSAHLIHINNRADKDYVDDDDYIEDYLEDELRNIPQEIVGSVKNGEEDIDE